MMIQPVVAVVTPVYNAADLIEETVKSVLGQSAFASGRADLRYVVVDGGSTDGTLERLTHFADGRLTVVSEPDHGMYDALAKGFRSLPDDPDVSCYLNAGDLWNTAAIDTVLDAFSVPDVSWICGYQVAYNKAGQVIYLRLPYRYRTRLIQAGVYSRALPPIQQESTFWRGQMLQLVDFERLASFRLAGDFYLWHTFSATTPLHTISSFLGGFRVHDNQLSSARRDYECEVATISSDATLWDRMLTLIDRIIWQMPDTVKRALGGRQILRYNLRDETWF